MLTSSQPSKRRSAASSKRRPAVRRGGHWGGRCLPEWGGERARREPFFAQAWYADHDPSEVEPYPATGATDVADADVEWRRVRLAAWFRR